MTIQISRTDLARNTRKVIEQARRNGPVMVESYGEEQVAIMDIIDYRLLRAAGSWEPDPSAPHTDPDAIPVGLATDEVEKGLEAADGNLQALWNLVIGTYLDTNISLGRAALLLEISPFELQDRLNRLDLPIRLGSRTIEEARLEIEAFNR